MQKIMSRKQIAMLILMIVEAIGIGYYWFSGYSIFISFAENDPPDRIILAVRLVSTGVIILCWILGLVVGKIKIEWICFLVAMFIGGFLSWWGVQIVHHLLQYEIGGSLFAFYCVTSYTLGRSLYRIIVSVEDKN